MSSNNSKVKQGVWVLLAAILVVILIALGVFSSDFMGKKDTDVATDTSVEAPVADTASTDNAEPAVAGENTLVAEVGDHKIYKADLEEFIKTLPQQVQQAKLEEIYPLLLPQVVSNEIISLRAEKSINLDDKDVRDRMAEAQKQIVRAVYLEREIEKRVTDASLRKSYDQLKAAQPAEEEVHARHILVKTEEEAKDLIEQLKKGADFGKLAEEHSEDPGAANGGDLGYFTKESMVPEFSEVAFAMKKGEVSATPVKTQFGWHVVKVEDKRVRPAPSFEEVKPYLDGQARREVYGKLLEEWRADTPVKLYDLNGQEIKEQALAPAAPAAAQ